jgi:hypothetical protein
MVCVNINPESEYLFFHKGGGIQAFTDSFFLLYNQNTALLPVFCHQNDS